MLVMIVMCLLLKIDLSNALIIARSLARLRAYSLCLSPRGSGDKPWNYRAYKLSSRCRWVLPKRVIFLIFGGDILRIKAERSAERRNVKNAIGRLADKLFAPKAAITRTNECHVFNASKTNRGQLPRAKNCAVVTFTSVEEGR